MLDYNKDTHILLDLEVRSIKWEKGDFNAYHTYDKKGYKITVKFRKTAKNLPDKNCNILVAKNKMNLSTAKKYRELWIYEIDNIYYDLQKEQDHYDLPF